MVHHTENAFLSEQVDLVYRLQNTQNTPQYYKTVTNGIIGLGIILKGSAFIDVDGQWEPIPRFSIFGMGEKPYHIKLSADYEEISIGFKPYAFNFFVNRDKFDVNLFPQRIGDGLRSNKIALTDLKIEYIDITADEFDVKLKDFESNLDKLFTESDKLEKEIQNNLKEMKI